RNRNIQSKQSKERFQLVQRRRRAAGGCLPACLSVTLTGERVRDPWKRSARHLPGNVREIKLFCEILPVKRRRRRRRRRRDRARGRLSYAQPSVSCRVRLRVRAPAQTDMYRSTKGASKARRDQINAEIRNLKELLPISEADKARLSYLHIMSLACMYTRKSVFFSQESLPASNKGNLRISQGLFGLLRLRVVRVNTVPVARANRADRVYKAGAAGGFGESASVLSFHELSELVHGLPGFLMLLTTEGKLLYLSDSVSEHLGHSMVDLVAQGDSVYDIIDPGDHFVMRSNLVPTTAPDTGHVNVYLGYSVEALRSHSWYSLVHPEDLSHASAQHCRLRKYPGCVTAPTSRAYRPPPEHRSILTQHCARLSEGGEGRVEMVLRVEAADHSWVWLYMVLHLESGETPISCHNYVISSCVWIQVCEADFNVCPPFSSSLHFPPTCSESEAWSIRQQLCAEQNQLALALSASASYQHSLGLQSPETLSSPDQVFTPSSSGLSGQSFDFSSGAEQGGSGTAAEPAQPEGGHPRSSLSSLEEESSGQQSQPPPRQQQQPPQPGDAASPPTPTSFPESSDLDFLAQSIFLSPPLRTDTCPAVIPLAPPPLTMPNPYQGKESLCTPPYTPQL
ncbi:hypothetical protein Z043_123411, partial [Scleropages formosus]